MGFTHNTDSIYNDSYDNHRNSQNFFRKQTEEKTNELKQHYEKLKDDLISLSEGLTIENNTVEGIPEWRKEIELLSLKIDLHEDLKHHLKKVKPKKNENNLLDDITTLQQK